MKHHSEMCVLILIHTCISQNLDTKTCIIVFNINPAYDTHLPGIALKARHNRPLNMNLKQSNTCISTVGKMVILEMPYLNDLPMLSSIIIYLRLAGSRQLHRGILQFQQP